MVDALQIFLRCAYWHSRATGFLNFEVDWPTGKAVTTRRATIFAVVHNVGLIALTFVLSLGLNPFNARFLHEYFILLTTAVRHLAVVLILASRWRHRHRILRLWNQLLRMICERPNVFRLYRRRIFVKFFFGTLADIMHTVLDLSAQRKKLNLDLSLNILVLYLLSTIFNISVFQYYLAELQVHGLYELIHRDLRKLMTEAETVCLIRNRRGGVFATKCCFLADQLDTLAKRHYKLRATMDEMLDLFKIQSLSMSIVYYLSTMSTIYFTFCSILYNTTGFDSSLWGFLLIAISIAFFIGDNCISLNLGFLIQDQVKKIYREIAERTLFSQELDARLETEFENFQLQLACNPIEYHIYGLFKVERGRIIGMINSAIMSSILLVQWELSQLSSKIK